MKLSLDSIVAGSAGTVDDPSAVLFGAVSETVIILDGKGRLKFVSSNAGTVFGHSPNEILSLGTVGRLFGRRAFRPAELVEVSHSYAIERSVVARSGDKRTIAARFERLPTDPPTILCTCRDVSELRRMEAELAEVRFQLRHAARLAQTGQLLSSILHDIRHLIYSVQLNARSGLKSLDDLDDHPATQAVDNVLHDIDSSGALAAGIVERLLRLSAGKPLSIQPIDANAAIAELLQLVEPETRIRRVLLRTEFASGLPRIEADPVALQQLVLDLVMNGIEAAELNDSPREVTVRTSRGNGTLEIAVSDTGGGIPEAQTDRLFDAFITSKPQGLGLGLAIARSIVSAHAGRIWVDGTGEAGTTFRVSLPLHAQVAGLPNNRSPRPQRRSVGHERAGRGREYRVA